MTCIAAFINRNGSVTMGGDSAGVAGLSIAVRKDPKVFIKKNMIFGFTSSFRMGQLIQYKFKIPTHPKRMPDFEYMATVFIDELRKCLKEGGFTRVESNEESGGCFLVGYRGRLYQINSDFQVGENHYPYDAVGCGDDIALGSLYTSSPDMPGRSKVLKALKAAAQFSAGVVGPFTILELPKE